MFAYLTQFKKGILDENPVFVKALALCPVLAITNNVENALGMGLATLLVLFTSCLIFSLLGNIIPSKVQIPCFLVLSAALTTIASLLMELYFPGLHNALGIFIPLILINSLLLARIDCFVTEGNFFVSAFSAIGIGLGFTLALTIMGLMRELLSFGTVLGFNVLPDTFPSFMIMAFPAGGFLAFGFIVAGLTALRRKMRGRKEV